MELPTRSTSLVLRQLNNGPQTLNPEDMNTLSYYHVIISKQNIFSNYFCSSLLISNKHL
jgi:hypothetical protein